MAYVLEEAEWNVRESTKSARFGRGGGGCGKGGLRALEEVVHVAGVVVDVMDAYGALLVGEDDMGVW